MPVEPTSEDCAPIAPSPIRGLRAIGLRLLDRELWPQDYRYNPLMIYRTGRKKPVTEDLLIVMPWAFIGGWNLMMAMGLDPISSPEYLLSMMIWQIAFYPVLAGQLASLAICNAVRRNIQEINLEEVLLTRLSPREIVHATAVRPMATLAITHLLFNLSLFFALVIDVFRKNEFSFLPLLFSALVVAISYSFMSTAVEIGSACGARAALYIQSSTGSRLRGQLDHLHSPAGVVIVVGGVGMFALLAFSSVLGGAAALAFWLVFGVRLHSRNILTQCGNFPQFWWRTLEQSGVAPQANWLAPWETIFNGFRAYDREERLRNFAAGYGSADRSASPSAPPDERP